MTTTGVSTTARGAMAATATATRTSGRCVVRWCGGRAGRRWASGSARAATGDDAAGRAAAARESAAAREAENSGLKPPGVVEKASAKDASGSLDLPLQSASARKRVGRTRLLRTPMAGGVVSRDTKDSNLPSMATAARNLMELADYGDLSTKMSDMHHRRAGYPFGSTVDFATDATGHPIFCLAPLAIHTRNIAADGRCSLTVKMSGWGGLANARVTIFGDVERLPKGEYQTAANEIFKAKYHGRKEAIDMEDRWGDYTFYP